MTDLTDLDLGQPKVEPICTALDVSEAVQDDATALARRADFEYPVNKSGAAIAAGAVYLQCLLHNEKRTQEAVAEAAGVSEMAIRNVYRDLATHEGFKKSSKPRRNTDTNTSPPTFFERLVGVFRS